jgi:hypothetical protein
MAYKLTCDVCSVDITPANPVVAKLYMAPVLPGKAGSNHNQYTGHLDVGKCCFSRTLDFGAWQRRQSRTIMYNQRKKRPGEINGAAAADSVEARAERKTRAA